MEKIGNKIRFAVIGAGHIGKQHIKVIIENADCELVAIIDKKQVAHGLEDHTTPFFKSLDEYFKLGSDCDVVCIATPNGYHASHAVKCLKKGKHVVIEKPMALTSGDGRRIIKVSQKARKHVFAVMQNRYSSKAKWLKEIIDTKALGNIYMVQVNCYWNRDERYYTPGNWHGNKEIDGGTLFTQFSHFIDLLYWVFGDFKKIRSRMANFNHKHLADFEDSGTITFDLKKGGIGSFNFSTAIWDQNMESSITVIGENGSIKLEGQYMDEITYCHIKDFTPSESFTSDQATGAESNHSYVFKNVIEVLRAGKKGSTNVKDGLRVIEIIERFYKAAGRNKIDL